MRQLSRYKISRKAFKRNEGKTENQQKFRIKRAFQMQTRSKFVRKKQNYRVGDDYKVESSCEENFQGGNSLLPCSNTIANRKGKQRINCKR